MKPKRLRKNYNLNLRLNQDEKAILKHLAKDATGGHLSDIVRLLIFSHPSMKDFLNSLTTSRMGTLQ